MMSFHAGSQDSVRIKQGLTILTTAYAASPPKDDFKQKKRQGGREKEKKSISTRAKNLKMRDASTYQALRLHTTCFRNQVPSEHLVSLEH